MPEEFPKRIKNQRPSYENTEPNPDSSRLYGVHENERINASEAFFSDDTEDEAFPTYIVPQVDYAATEKYQERERVLAELNTAVLSNDEPLVKHLTWRKNFLALWLDQMRKEGFVPLDRSHQPTLATLEKELTRLKALPEFPNLPERTQKTYQHICDLIEEITTESQMKKAA